MEERTAFKNLMYELYKEDYSKYTGIIWDYDYFFSHYTALEYYADKAELTIRKRKIERIKNGMDRSRE